jgi:Protein of unknown function (DUF2637)
MINQKFKAWTRWLALAGITAITLSATSVAFVESYDGLKAWAEHHFLSGIWAIIWPIQVDAFILIGELALYVAVLEHWSWRRRAMGWVVTLLGGVVSTLGNVGHIGGDHSLPTYGTAAVPPLAATAGLAVGLQVLKWVLNLVRSKTTVRFRVVTSAPGAFQLAPLSWTLRRLPGAGTVPASVPVPQPVPLAQPRVPVLEPQRHRAVAAASGRARMLTMPGTPEVTRAQEAYAESVQAGQPLSARALAAILRPDNPNNGRRMAARIIERHTAEATS